MVSEQLHLIKQGGVVGDGDGYTTCHRTRALHTGVDGALSVPCWVLPRPMLCCDCHCFIIIVITVVVVAVSDRRLSELRCLAGP